MSQMTVQRSYKTKPTSSQLTRQEVLPKPQSSVDTESAVPPKYTMSTHSSKLCPYCPLNVYSTWAHNVLVTQSCPTLCDPMDHSTPGSSVHGILHGENTPRGVASIPSWVTMIPHASRHGQKIKTNKK